MKKLNPPTAFNRWWVEFNKIDLTSIIYVADSLLTSSSTRAEIIEFVDSLLAPQENWTKTHNMIK
jgi:hypothetical protein